MGQIILLVYIAGFLTSYYMIRKLKRKQLKQHYDYGTVLAIFCFSLFSWLMVLIWGIVELSENESTPPKWL